MLAQYGPHTGTLDCYTIYVIICNVFSSRKESHSYVTVNVRQLYSSRPFIIIQTLYLTCHVV